MGRDKATLDYHGIPQARWAFELLSALCESTYVSVRRAQSETPPYDQLPLIVDEEGTGGPSAGLRAAQHAAPHAAWLIAAGDMPLIDSAMLKALVAQRDTSCLATAFRRPEGMPEPLCAIYEPTTRTWLESAATQTLSLRRLLEAGPTRFVELRDPDRLRSVNTAQDDAEIRAELGHSHRPE
jgi:molybdopterin-guanine dinucleotide biosynthesis protein A